MSKNQFVKSNILFALNKNDVISLKKQIDLLKKRIQLYIEKSNENYQDLIEILNNLLKHKIFNLDISLINYDDFEDFYDYNLKSEILKMKNTNIYNGAKFEIIYILGKILLLKSEY